MRNDLDSVARVIADVAALPFADNWHPLPRLR